VTEKFDLYKCQVCGNVVQVLLNGVGQLVCCEQPMTNMVPREETGNELAEKHTPVVEQEEDKRFVRLRMHPMSEEHYIQFIEVYTKDKKNLHLKFLEPNEVAEFDITNFEENLEALELCNIHGLWRRKND
jgi:superoxide reductase